MEKELTAARLDDPLLKKENLMKKMVRKQSRLTQQGLTNGGRAIDEEGPQF